MSDDGEAQRASGSRNAPRSGDGADPEGADWPVELRGVTESVVATLDPNGRWNFAALGLRAPGGDGGGPADRVTARTWGATRTRRNFGREGGGVVQFVADPREFVDAALTVREGDDPVLDGADAWVRVEAERIDAGEAGETDWVDWALSPVEAAVRRTAPRTINRGFYAVIDATVAASRLDVPAYDTDALLDRLAYFADVVERCGGPRERAAFDRIDAATGWRSRRED